MRDVLIIKVFRAHGDDPKVMLLLVLMSWGLDVSGWCRHHDRRWADISSDEEVDSGPVWTQVGV